MQRRTFLGGLAAAGAVAASGATAQEFELAERFRPLIVPVKRGVAPGQILVLPQAHYLYYVDAPGQAIRYGVGVGRAGLAFKGVASIEAKKKWPSWRPTDEMIEREPETYKQYEDGVPGGPDNPLGARALYLFQNGRDTYFRIHGTTEPRSIGRSVSNGCIRMLNAHVKDLYERVPLGTRVVVF
ncbi:L,D-transpeptidase [Tranquillimonas alkanivorans]|uniref:Tat (Twin-arginine translocation) pathway signal sequence n=1 Tax=Tranquillimonas alkanivorans TaxID=441119 RepID=A0A1I5NAU0_9RHOB|nr:L,D-transpeptidase [Tranquillimonas alkanivorans]SFP18820.1 Tat (twin-arginine translocation) pathway signal sequence [Tranquillimonas alkanivorans]